MNWLKKINARLKGFALMQVLSIAFIILPYSPKDVLLDIITVLNKVKAKSIKAEK